MATISGGSKPTFTVDQVLHAVEMNQLNQEWIVDSVPPGSAGKNGDVVFVTSKGGVWAKVSGSWVQASLTSADMQALQDQIDAIQSSGYDDTQLRSDFAAADAATLTSANDYTDQEIAGITVPDVSTKFDKGATTYADAKAMEDAIAAKSSISHTHDDLGGDPYDDSWIQPALDAKSNSSHTHDTSHNHDQEYQAKGDYALDTHTHPPQDLTHNHDSEYADKTTTNQTLIALANDIDSLETKTYNNQEAIKDKADSDHVHVQTGSGLTFDPAREGQVVQSTNGTDWTAGMSLRVVTSVPDDTEGEIGDVVFVVGS